VLHATGAHVADDLVVAVLVHPDDKAGLQLCVVDDSKSAEACVASLPERDAGTDAAELKWTVCPHQMRFGRYDASPWNGCCMYGHVLFPWLRRLGFDY
jgi:hypothetical protein